MRTIKKSYSSGKKRCIDCHEEKDVSVFSWRSTIANSKKHGRTRYIVLRGPCTPCHRIRQKKYSSLKYDLIRKKPKKMC